MRPVQTYTADGLEFLGPSTTASGLASAAQLTDVTPSTIVIIGESASPSGLRLVRDVTDFQIPDSLTKEPYLSAEDDPLLAELWDNEADAIYDDL